MSRLKMSIKSCNEKTTNKIYNPINNKCISKTSKAGKDLLLLISTCKNNPKLDVNCTKINKIYKSYKSKIPMYILYSIILLQVIGVILLTKQSVRLKIINYILRKDRNIHVLLFKDNITNLVKSFLTEYSNLGTSYIYSVVLGSTDQKKSSSSEYFLAPESPIQELPGAWPTKVSPIIQKEVQQNLKNGKSTDVDKLAMTLLSIPGKWSQEPVQSPKKQLSEAEAKQLIDNLI